MLHKRGLHIGAGALFSLALVGLLYTILLGARVDHVAGSTYVLHAVFDDVGALELGSPVTIGGLPVGKIVAMRFNPRAFSTEVDFSIQKSAVPFPEDSIAVVATYGLFGDNYISISPGGDTDVLQEGDTFSFVGNAVPLDSVLRVLGKTLTERLKK